MARYSRVACLHAIAILCCSGCIYCQLSGDVGKLDRKGSSSTNSSITHNSNVPYNLESAAVKGSLEVPDQVILGPLVGPDVVALRRQEAAVVEHGNHTARGVSFDCSGMQCAGMLYIPKTSVHTTDASKKQIAKPPIIVMAHGLGGEKTWLGKFASVFAEAGLAVLAFDYRHWGASDGEPRQWISISKQHDDWFAAIQYVQQSLVSVVDSSRLVLWGTSFAGGHVIVVGSKLPGQVKAVISNVPHLDGIKATQANAAKRGAAGNTLMAMAAVADLAADRKGGGPPVYIPLAGVVGSTALMQLDKHDMEVYSSTHTHTLSEWRNLTRARFATETALKRYSPINLVDNLRCPLLIIAGKQDRLCPYASAVAAVARAPQGSLVSFDVGHFDPYVQPTLGLSLSKQLEFLKDVLQ